MVGDGVCGVKVRARRGNGCLRGAVGPLADVLDAALRMETRGRRQAARSSRLLGNTPGYVKMGEIEDSPNRVAGPTPAPGSAREPRGPEGSDLPPTNLGQTSRHDGPHRSFVFSKFLRAWIA